MRTNMLFSVSVAHPALRTRARAVSYRQGDLLGETGCRIDDIVFLRSGMISVVVGLPSGDEIETAMIGYRSAAGLEALFGVSEHLNTNVVQLPGQGWRLKASDVVEALQKDPALGPVIFRCHELLLVQSQQSVACNAKHPIVQRLASWLLRARDTSGDDELALTQEFVAQMLGVQRATVSTMAVALQGEGAIASRRGKIKIIDSERLAKQSCGCHRIVREQQSNLMGDGIANGTVLNPDIGADRARP